MAKTTAAAMMIGLVAAQQQFGANGAGVQPQWNPAATATTSATYGFGSAPAAAWQPAAQATTGATYGFGSSVPSYQPAAQATAAATYGYGSAPDNAAIETKGIPIDIGRIVDSDLVYPGRFPDVAWSGALDPRLQRVTAWDAVAANLNTDGVLDGPGFGQSGVPIAVGNQLANMGMAPKVVAGRGNIVSGGAYSAYGNSFGYPTALSGYSGYPTTLSGYSSGYNPYGASYGFGTSFGAYPSVGYPSTSFGYSGYPTANYGTSSFYGSSYGAYPSVGLGYPTTGFGISGYPTATYGGAYGFGASAPAQVTNWGPGLGFGNGVPTTVKTGLDINPTNVGAPVAQIPYAALNAYTQG